MNRRILWGLSVLFFLALQLWGHVLSAVFDQQGAVGWWAHLGGLGAGAALTPLLIRRELRLFGRVIPGKP